MPTDKYYKQKKKKKKKKKKNSHLCNVTSEFHIQFTSMTLER